MRKEYWATIWVKISFFLMASTFIPLGGLGLTTKKIQMDIGLIFIGICILTIGLFFFIHVIVLFRWPVFIIKNDSIHYRGYFGVLYIYKSLGDYFIEPANNGIFIYDSEKKKHGLRTGSISKRQHDELYEHILQYAKPLSKVNE